MGASGSGKSTLLTIAGSLEAADQRRGRRRRGARCRRCRRNDQARLRRRSIGYVFQDFNLLAGLTAAENVSLPLELDGVSAKKARAAGMAVLEELGLADRAVALPRRAVGRRAPTGGHRPGRGRRAPPAAGRRALGGARLDQRRGGDADDPRRLQARRGRGRGHPRCPAGLVGRPGGLPPGRAGRRPDLAAAEPRVVARSPPRIHDDDARSTARLRRAARPTAGCRPAGPWCAGPGVSSGASGASSC